MAIRRFERLTTADESLNKVQERIADVLLPFADAPIVDGHLIQNQDLVSGTTSTISHSLGRNLIGYIVVKRSAAQHVYDVQDTNDNPSTTLLLTAGGTVTVDLWVF